MEAATDYIARLNDLQAVVFRDPGALELYKKYLSLHAPKYSNHIDFFEDLIAVETYNKRNKSGRSVGGSVGSSQADDMKKINFNEEEDRITHEDIYLKYFSGECEESVLQIKESILQEVREKAAKATDTTYFKPAVYAVVRELCYENFQNFVESSVFQEYKEYLCVSSGADEEMLNLPVKERGTAIRLRKFFGEKLDEGESKRRTFRAQPQHVKSFKLNKKFGERVLVEKEDSWSDFADSEISDTPPSESPSCESSPPTSPNAYIQPNWRRSRKLHIFFGDLFNVDDVMFTEKVRAPNAAKQEEPVAEENKDNVSKQPQHVNTHRVNRFFGERVRSGSISMCEATQSAESDSLSDEVELEDYNDSVGEDEEVVGASSRLAKTQRIRRFFGERIDLSKEAASKSFADQPPHVKPLKLKKIFGTSVISATDSSGMSSDESGPALETKRMHKLHKFFGSKEIDFDLEDEDGASVVHGDERLRNL